MKRFFLFYFSLIVCAGAIFAQQLGRTNPVKPIIKPVPPSSNIMMAEMNDDYDCVLQAVTSNILRVSFVKKGNDLPQPKLVLPINEKPECTYSHDEYSSSLSARCFTASIRNTAVTITDNYGNVLSFNGMPQITDGEQVITIDTNKKCAFYGAGERGHSLNLAGDTLVCYNRQNYGYTEGDPRISQMGITMPLLISDAGYAVVFDDYAKSSIVASNPIVYSTKNVTQPVDFYIITADVKNSLYFLISDLSRLTGRQQMPPLWSMGYITSKYGYKTQKETLGVIDTLQRKGYPVDGIVLDLYWYGKEQDMGSLSWEKSQWQDHKKMLSTLKKKGVNLIAISQPYVLRNGRGIDNYNDLSAKGMFCTDADGNTHEVKIWVGEGGMFDVSNPDTYDWLYNRYKLLTDEGITGWWGDLGEPEVHPLTAFHKNGLSAELYHNVYGNDWSKIIADLFKNEYPNTRLMTMMRGGTIGLQRYNVFPWSTDVSRSWGGLQPQIKIMLNSGLSGMGYMSHDVGGFAIDPANPVDPELYIRWLQLGVFSPILRTHAQQVAEPYKYPEYQDIILPLIKARYEWLPYNYTLASENATNGSPLVRPMNFYKYSPKAVNITDQYLWGRNVLVAPVIEQGAKSRKVSFTEGEWVDITNPDKVYSDTVIDYPVTLATLPMFVRLGSFIPKAEYKMRNVGDYRTDRYTIHFYPSEKIGNDKIFEDTNSLPSASTDYKCWEINMSGNNKSISVNTLRFENAPKTKKSLTFVVHRAQKPEEVKIDDKPTKFTYNEQDKTITFSFDYIPSDKPVNISF